jgi:hypothetical protein
MPGEQSAGLGLRRPTPGYQPQPLPPAIRETSSYVSPEWGTRYAVRCEPREPGPIEAGSTVNVAAAEGKLFDAERRGVTSSERTSEPGAVTA